MKIRYGVYGGKTFGGKFPMVNKYFKKKTSAVSFKEKYESKFPKRKLKLVKF